MTATGAKVLIVDDEAEFVEFVGKFLVTSGYDVDRALHGADALMAIALARPDVVLLDVRMSGIHGVDVLKRIRSMDPTIPVIIVTADDDPVLLSRPVSSHRQESGRLGRLPGARRRSRNPRPYKRSSR